MKHITEMLGEICCKMCDNYCKYPEQYESQYKDPDMAWSVCMNERCKDCPISKI
jgi:hypothetical protein